MMSVPIRDRSENAGPGWCGAYCRWPSLSSDLTGSTTCQRAERCGAYCRWLSLSSDFTGSTRTVHYLIYYTGNTKKKNPQRKSADDEKGPMPSTRALNNMRAQLTRAQLTPAQLLAATLLSLVIPPVVFS